MFGAVTLSYVQSLGLIAILVVKLFKPDRIENDGALKNSFLLLIAAIIIPSFVIFFPSETSSFADFSKLSSDGGIMPKVLNAAGAVLTGSSLYCFWNSLKS